MPNPERYRDLVTERAKHHCEYCHYPQSVCDDRLEIEHIKPRSLGGRTEPTNLTLACGRCNRHKGTKVSGTDSATRHAARPFNPRIDDLEDHLQLDRATGVIEGLTPLGSATVHELRMNDAMTRSVRLLLIALSLL